MTDRKELPIGRLIFEEIDVDVSWLDHIDRVRESGRGYRPGKAVSRPSTFERPKAGKPGRTAEQLKLDLVSVGHERPTLPVVGHSASQRRCAMSAGSDMSGMSRSVMTFATRRQALKIVV